MKEQKNSTFLKLSKDLARHFIYNFSSVISSQLLTRGSTGASSVLLAVAQALYLHFRKAIKAKTLRILRLSGSTFRTMELLCVSSRISRRQKVQSFMTAALTWDAEAAAIGPPGDSQLFGHGSDSSGGLFGRLTQLASLQISQGCSGQAGLLLGTINSMRHQGTVQHVAACLRSRINVLLDKVF